MVPWLRRFLRPRASRATLLNDGLELAMDWGAEWLSPIQSRLLALHPHLGAEELEQLNAECQGATRLARETLHRALNERVTEPSLDSLSAVVLERHPWVEPRNLERLHRHGLYHAAKVGGHAPVTAPA